VKRILILGGGFAGAYAAQQLEKHIGQGEDLEMVLSPQEQFKLFAPMIPEVAEGGRRNGGRYP
jgi:NADH:ubiquinone reductase (H+-translocating)